MSGILSHMSLLRSVFDTNSLPEKKRVPLWRDSATSVWDISAITDETFHASVDAFHAADLMFGTVTSSGQKTERIGSRIAADSLDYYMLQFYVRGQRSATTRGQEYLAADGDMLVVDMAQPIQTASTTYQSFDLVMPRRLFDPLLKNPDTHGGRRLAAELPLTALLRSHVLALYRAGPHMTSADAIAMQGPTLALAAAALNGTINEEQTVPLRTATWLAVRRHIEDNLTDFTLSANRVARHFALSRATLYRVMGHVHGFHTYIRQRRLYRCRDDLANPAHHHYTISEIAASWGFANASAFSALFSRTFDMSPRDYRELAFSKVLDTSDTSSEIDWSRWLAAMR